MPNGKLVAEDVANSVICVPLVALVGIRAILPTEYSVNQIAPSLPRGHFLRLTGCGWRCKLGDVGSQCRKGRGSRSRAVVCSCTKGGGESILHFCAGDAGRLIVYCHREPSCSR